MTGPERVPGTDPGAPRPPWLVGVPLLLGALILGALWVARREPLYLGAAIVALAWAALWMWGAARGRRGDARASSAPPYHPPRPGEVVVLGRARWRGGGVLPLRRAGVVLAGAQELLWVAGDITRLGRIGQTLPLSVLPAGGRSPAEGGGEVKTIAALADLESYRLVAGVFGADTLTLRLRSGDSVTLRSLDPELPVLLTEAFAALDRDGDDEDAEEQERS